MVYKLVDYVWIGGKNEVRSKVRVLDSDDIPEWNYDGSSCWQTEGEDSEVILKPVRIFPCPFRRNNGFIALCDTYLPSGEPAPNNNRHQAKQIFDRYLDQEPWFGLEQEYFIIDPDTDLPVGMKSAKEQGQYYCSVGGNNAFARNLCDMHMEYCLYAGIKISGTNAEVAPGQWEFQIGPVEGIDAADQLWTARFILHKISEKLGCSISLDPKPVDDWNGSGCHTNFSTKAMREEGGLDVIMSCMPKLEAVHLDHMRVYGEGNDKRMSGMYETSSYDRFSYGIGNRSASIRIPNDTVKNGCGYFEDRRPASNMDPYSVTSVILETICQS